MHREHAAVVERLEEPTSIEAARLERAIGRHTYSTMRRTPGTSSAGGTGWASERGGRLRAKGVTVTRLRGARTDARRRSPRRATPGRPPAARVTALARGLLRPGGVGPVGFPALEGDREVVVVRVRLHAVEVIEEESRDLGRSSPSSSRNRASIPGFRRNRAMAPYNAASSRRSPTSTRRARSAAPLAPSSRMIAANPAVGNRCVPAGLHLCSAFACANTRDPV